MVRAYASNDRGRGGLCERRRDSLPLQSRRGRSSSPLRTSVGGRCSTSLVVQHSRRRTSIRCASMSSSQRGHCGGTLSEVGAGFGKVQQLLGARVGASPKSLARPLPPAPSSTSRKVPASETQEVVGLEPEVVSSALAAGIPMAHLLEMGAILKSKPQRIEELPRKKAEAWASQRKLRGGRGRRGAGRWSFRRVWTPRSGRIAAQCVAGHCEIDGHRVKACWTEGPRQDREPNGRGQWWSRSRREQYNFWQQEE